jgi:hypothetical protein
MWLHPGGSPTLRRLLQNQVPALRQSRCRDDYRRPLSCRLKLAPDCTVVVQGDYLELDRAYLSSTLPQAIVLAEKARIFSGFDSRLMHVSRKNHCAIIRQGDHWLLRAYKPTYVNGRPLNNGQTVTIQPPGAEVVLGNGGWPITIELFEA